MHDKIFYTTGYQLSKVLIIATCISWSSGCTTSTLDTPSTTTISKTSPAATDSHQQNTAYQQPQPAMGQTKFPLDCSAPLLLPATFTTRKERIRVYEPTPELINTPAVIDWGIKRIQTAPARFTNETVAAQYREVTEEVSVLRERTELIGIPATYTTLARRVTLTPAHTRWKKGCVSSGQSPSACFENVAATTRTLQQRIINTPNRIIQKHIPSKTIKITKKVLVKPGVGSGPLIPAQYAEVKVGKVRSVWQLTSKPSAPRYETIEVQIKTRPEQIKSMAVLCEHAGGAAPALIRQLQQRLRNQGYPASLSGQLDHASRRALIKFQQDKGLFIGGVSAQTLARLGLK